MIYYYFNQQTNELMIFNPETQDLVVLERLEGIRVITGSEMARPVNEPRTYKNHLWNPVTGKAKKYGKKKGGNKPSTCKICGEKGHRSDSRKFHPK